MKTGGDPQTSDQGLAFTWQPPYNDVRPVNSPAPLRAGGPVLTVPDALAFHVMAKPTGAVCNLDCE